MDRQGRDDRPPTWLYGLIGLVVCAVLFAGYGWLVEKWGALTVVWVEVGILVVVVIVGVMLSLRRPRR